MEIGLKFYIIIEKIAIDNTVNRMHANTKSGIRSSGAYLSSLKQMSKEPEIIETIK